MQETDEYLKKISETLAKKISRSDKLTWFRKLDRMVSLHSQVTPLEEKILNLIAKKQPLVDELAELRNQMLLNCVHPPEYLVVKENNGNRYVECKFCNGKFALPEIVNE